MRKSRLTVLLRSGWHNFMAAQAQLNDQGRLVGEAQLIDITPCGTDGIIVRLYGITFWASADLRKAFETAAEAGLVPYAVNGSCRPDGLRIGTIGDSQLARPDTKPSPYDL